ncbi:response regulator [Limibacter armeniacum]|uniref:response regulator transcription factor n=1 Tax=Limibacter armeniacum TaxID=466084 RepID=UPI002FE6436C
MKILIMDDEPNILMSLDFSMRKAGHEVFIARDLAEALEALDHERPEIVILDLTMQGIDGQMICDHIQKSTALAETNVIFLSSNPNETDIQKGLEMGAKAYISKPFSTRFLIKEVERIYNG